MAMIPFIHSKIFPAEQTADYLEQRFTKHLRRLRCGQARQARIGKELPEADIDELLETTISHLDSIKVQKRVKRLLKRRQEASGIRHLSVDERERLAGLAGGVQLAEVPTEHRADEIAASLY